ncbi:uncharacterized protein B0T15DRAFT_304879 [Chaetomium strumarium]|uniref:Uncharacterized protein n=1 Tax=Chaetomium strumarium TaxID=1170767 RepID=A0AAJ0GM04_9PEZI|nr:hypothetical protein B0T15DRAFT_304879 [Chaetomium strumarium]
MPIRPLDISVSPSISHNGPVARLCHIALAHSDLLLPQHLAAILVGLHSFPRRAGNDPGLSFKSRAFDDIRQQDPAADIVEQQANELPVLSRSMVEAVLLGHQYLVALLFISPGTLYMYNNQVSLRPGEVAKTTIVAPGYPRVTPPPDQQLWLSTIRGQNSTWLPAGATRQLIGCSFIHKRSLLEQPRSTTAVDPGPGAANLSPGLRRRSLIRLARGSVFPGEASSYRTRLLDSCQWLLDSRSPS